MDSNTQVNENYKFKIKYVIEFLKDMVSESGDVDDKELNSQIRMVEEQQDTKHISSLEKDIETHQITKNKRTSKSSSKEAKINNDVKEKTNSINNEAILDEEKER